MMFFEISLENNSEKIIFASMTVMLCIFSKKKNRKKFNKIHHYQLYPRGKNKVRLSVV